MSISKGFHGSNDCKIYVSENELIWEYKWFYHDEEKVHLVAIEYKTGKTLQEPLKTQGDMGSEIIKILEDASK
ncbi:hypothetical protein ACFSY7_08210 [Kurthia populi]|uniref:Uncharacterized protein n=1 Tax=Kurthia populi TaxID=1562132 RepID=A0ABW5XZN2_9BACL